jgi:hypothetical protein
MEYWSNGFSDPTRHHSIIPSLQSRHLCLNSQIFSGTSATRRSPANASAGMAIIMRLAGDVHDGAV